MASIPRSQRIAKRLPGPASDDAVSGPAEQQQPEEAPAGLRRGSRNRRHNKLNSIPKGFEGFPSFLSLQPVLLFFLFPIVIIIAAVVSGGSMPVAILYPIALIMGAYVAYTTLNGLELVIACLLLYLPFSTTHAIPIAPGVNGTNMLLLLGLGGAIFQAFKGRGWFVWLPGTALVYLFGFISAMSGFTTLALTGGYDHLIYNELLNYKGWLEQFLFFFVLQCGIRDREMAKRLVLYMGLSSIALTLYVVPEMIEKAGRSTIEASRLEGPHRQSNNFGGFVAYALMPPLAIFIVYMHNVRAWLITPYFLLTLKILITTFSRGAYLALALGAFCAGYFRGKGFVVFWASLGLVFLLIFPQFVPESIKARMQTLSSSDGNHNTRVTEDQLDASSRDRLILWRAAARIAIENPLTGLGFKSFPLVKDGYTDVQLFHVSDPHNMYLSLAAEMGLPAVSLFLLILYFSYRMGSTLSQNRSDHFMRAVGIGGVAATACYAVICVFGSRAVNLEFSCFFWALFVIMQVFMADPEVLAGQGRQNKKRDLPLSKQRSRAGTDGLGSTIVPKSLRAGAKKSRRTNAFVEQKNAREEDDD